MKAKSLIVDTGPLIAYLNKHDRYHDWAVAQLATANPPLITCESVLSEACFLLRRFKCGAVNVLKLLERQLLALPFCLEEEAEAVGTLIKKYKDVPMSLADACLVVCLSRSPAVLS